MFSLLNIRGLVPQTVPTKVPFLQDELESSNYIAFALTETWLEDSHKEAELHIPGYTLFRQDRKGRTKSKTTRSSGGVAIYVRDDYAISSEICFEFSNGVIESLGVTLRSLNLVIVVTYRSPDSKPNNKDFTHKPERKWYRSTSKEFTGYLNQLNKCLKSLPSPTPDILLMGDYNLPHANWLTGECSPGASKDEKKMAKDLSELSLENFLVQQVEVPTHKEGNTLDLIFTNNTDLIHNLSTAPVPRTSDHYLINFTAVYSNCFDATDMDPETDDSEENTRKGFSDLNFFSEDINWSSMNDELGSYNWSAEFRGLDTTAMMERFTSVCCGIAQKFVPERRRSSISSKSRIPRHRRILMRRRTSTRKQLAKTSSDDRRQALTARLVEIEKELQMSHRQQQEYDEQRAVENIKANPKFFFSYAKKFSKVKTTIGPLINSAKTLISAPKKMAEILSEQYCSVFSTPRHENSPPHILFPKEDTTGPSLTDILFTDEELREAMKELSDNAAAGPDGFPAILLKRCCFNLCAPLGKIWRKSLQDGVVPPICKTATIIPIHKGKSRAAPKNYRPVALTSQLIKVFEKVVRKHMVAFMEEHNLLNQSQHGFRRGRSCLSQLIDHCDRITAAMERGLGIDVIYLDFAKAFDKVDLGITLRKLKSLGIKGQLGQWLMAFLLDRVQSVLVHGKKSTPQRVISGVPQGSVLGPLLFIVLIGDIDKNIAHSFLSSFADDTRIGRPISTDTDVKLLQEDLESVYQWSVENNMQFNSDKFELMRYCTNSSSEVQNSTTYLSNSGSAIEEKQHVRDLGVTLSSDATFSQHILSKTMFVRSQISWVLRTFNTRDAGPLLALWKTLIVCHLDYCSQLWSPSKKGDIQSLELLQKAFIGKIRGMSSLNYWKQLSALSLYSLERRRERYQIIYTWRIIEGQVPNLSLNPVEYQWHPRRGRECHIPGITTTAPSAIQTLREASLPIKGPRLFNCLPQHIRNASGCTTEAFKCMLDKYLKTVPDEPHIPGLTQYRRCESNSITDWTRHPAQHVEPMLDDERHDQDLAAHRGSRIATSWGPSPRTPPSDYRVSDRRMTFQCNSQEHNWIFVCTSPSEKALIYRKSELLNAMDMLQFDTTNRKIFSLFFSKNYFTAYLYYYNITPYESAVTMFYYYNVFWNETQGHKFSFCCRC